MSYLRGIERLILQDKLTSLSEFKKKIDKLFSASPTENPMASLEASRLAGIAGQWFFSLVDASLWLDSEDTLETQDNNSKAIESLNLLNPDNKGIISATERVRTIGEEVPICVLYNLTLIANN